jgi:hypothetical protein
MKKSKLFLLMFVLLTASFGCRENIKRNNIEFEIRPPFDFDVPYVIYNIPSDLDTVLVLKSGTKISILKDCFLNKDGQRIRGPVEIKFRELNSMLDIFISGIPLTIKCEDKIYPLSTMGMFEIRGYQNGKEIFIDPSKAIMIDKIASDKALLYSTYYFNVKEGTWETFNSCKIILQAKKELDKGIIVPSKPRNKASDEKRVLFITPENPMEFPELIDFVKVKFYVVDTCLFDPADAANDWNEVKIEKVPGQDLLFSIHFEKKGSNGNEVKRIYTVEPVYEGKNYEKAKCEYKERYTDYQSRVNYYNGIKAKKEEKLNRLIDSIKILQEENVRSIEFTQDLNESLEYLKYYRFNITTFGVCNIDMRLPLQNEIRPPRKFYSSSKKINVDYFALVGIEDKSLLRFTGNMEFYFDKNITYYLWGITKDNRFFYLDGEEFAREINRNDKIIEVHLIDKPFKFFDDLKTVIKNKIEVEL